MKGAIGLSVVPSVVVAFPLAGVGACAQDIKHEGVVYRSVGPESEQKVQHADSIEVHDELKNVGETATGRRTADMAGTWMSRSFSVVAMLIAGALSSASAKDAVLFKETAVDAGAPISRETAVDLAMRYIGVRPEYEEHGIKITARHGLATDGENPFFAVTDRPAWEVVFDGMPFAALTLQHAEVVNPHITTLTALVDAGDGSLLKVSSPRPVAEEDRLTSLIGSDMRREVTLNRKSMTCSKAVPATPFLVAFRRATESSWRGELPKHVVAYFGSLTQLGYNAVHDRLFWYVAAGGLESDAHRHGRVIRRASVLLDDESGKIHSICLSGGGGGPGQRGVR